MKAPITRKTARLANASEVISLEMKVSGQEIGQAYLIIDKKKDTILYDGGNLVSAQRAYVGAKPSKLLQEVALQLIEAHEIPYRQYDLNVDPVYFNGRWVIGETIAERKRPSSQITSYSK